MKNVVGAMTEVNAIGYVQRGVEILMVMAKNSIFEPSNFNQPDHFLVLEKLYARCAHDSCSLSNLLIFLNVNLDQMDVLVEFIYDLPHREVIHSNVQSL